MAQHNNQIALEKALTERLAQLLVPIRIVPHSAWYQWSTPPAGTGDCGTFEDSVLQAIAYQQEQYQTQRLVATPKRYTLETMATLGDCLHQTRKVRPTPVLYLSLGATSWLESTDAHERVARSRDIDLSWDAYTEDGHGPDLAGIYLFGTDGNAYRAFDIDGGSEEKE